MEPLFLYNKLWIKKPLLVLLIVILTGTPVLAQFDFCATPTVITTGAGCGTTYTVKGATATAGVSGSCGNALSADVWFRYTPTNAYPVITINNFGSSFQAAGATIQLLSGASCAGLTSLGCVTAGTSATSLTLNTWSMPGGSGLSVGTPYYIRILMATNTGATAGASANWNFRICVNDPPAAGATLSYGKSYVNITKGVSGGTVEPLDVLEMHTTFLVSANTAYRVSVSGNIPTGTTYQPGTLKILTNEGQVYKSWTDAADGDPGTVSGSTITINVGSGANGTVGGSVNNLDRPTLFGSQCLIVAAYQVKVNAVSYGTVINNITGGTLSYTNSVGTVTTINFPTVNTVVYKNYGICNNTIGSNGILSEFGGTFGSGNLKNRGASSKVPSNYTYTVLTSGAPVDNFYGVSNNTSSGGAGGYSTNPNDPLAATHIFNVWDIIGDHTGTNNTVGNPPGDTTGGKSAGYMVVVNAAFRTDTAFLDTVKNLCPNTYYEYSAWFRNICKKCSGDSTGKSPATTGYVPTGTNDSSGVHPNLTFNINGYDYYTTGDIMYTGQWIKKGFTYLTGPAQTQMIISIRNNAPGGGGNDWVIDDIGVATCTPNLALTPSTNMVNACFGDSTAFTASVTSYFNNYTEYTWERSTNNGVTWTTTGFSGTGSPVFNGTEYVYNAAGPKIRDDSSTHNNIFRLRVASTSSNLADPNCSFSGTRTVQVYVHNCMFLLDAAITGFSGQLKNAAANLQWQTENESGKIIYSIEKSTDGINFASVGTVTANGINGKGNYNFKDPEGITTASYYRIKMTEEAQFRYSKIIVLSPGKIQFDVKNIVNPFSGTLQFDAVLPAQGDIKITMYDNYGRLVKTVTQTAGQGVNNIRLSDLSGLANGVYTLKTTWQQETISKRIIKTNN